MSDDNILPVSLVHADAQIRRLQADRDRLAAECKALSDQCQDVRAQRDKAQAELEAANQHVKVVRDLHATTAAELSAARAALAHVRASAQTGTYDGGVVVSFAAFEAVRAALSAGSSREGVSSS